VLLGLDCAGDIERAGTLVPNRLPDGDKAGDAGDAGDADADEDEGGVEAPCQLPRLLS